MDDRCLTIWNELLARVWKEPAFFLAHAEGDWRLLGRECTRRGVPPATVNPVLVRPSLPGGRAASFLATSSTWRATRPTSSCSAPASSVAVWSVCFKPGLPGEVSPSLSVRLMGIDQRGVASYLVSLYCSLRY